jgi:hypothetical protein
MFLTPGVTPWKTTLPGVVDGANNPGIRIFEYDRATLNLKVRSLGLLGWGKSKSITTFPNLQLTQLLLTTEPWRMP